MFGMLTSSSNADGVYIVTRYPLSLAVPSMGCITATTRTTANMQPVLCPIRPNSAFLQDPSSSVTLLIRG